MSKKHAKIPFAEKVFWYVMIIGALFALLSVVPALPWRYAKVDTNVGNRFVMERYYYLTGATNNLGKSEGWLSLRTKFQRKVEEYGKPSPITALLGTAGQALGTGGAAMGCMMWEICKNHVSVRFVSFGTVGYSAIASMILIIIGALLSIGSTVFLGFEQAAGEKKKKKKKKDDECAEPVTKTMLMAVHGFLFCATGVTMFVCILGNTLKEFQQTAYYPFAGSHAAPFVGGFGCFLLFIGASIGTNRAYHCCSKKKDEEGEGEFGGEYGGYGAPPGAYGAPPGAYGAPPGAYGPPPGAYGPPGGQGQW